MVPPLPRLPTAHGLVERGAYFVIHAPRQTGKTTFLRAFATQLTSEGRFTALYMSCEAASAFEDDIVASQAVLVRTLQSESAKQLPLEIRSNDANGPSALAGASSRKRETLSEGSAVATTGHSATTLLRNESASSTTRS